MASSNSNIPPGRSKARAMAIRCDCPSLNPVPCSPQRLSRPSGSWNTKSAQAWTSAVCISSSVACGLPSNRFSRMVPLKRVFPCGTYVKQERVPALHSDCLPWLSYNMIFPAVGWIKESIRRIKVVFPAPVSPITAVWLPGGKS